MSYSLNWSVNQKTFPTYSSPRRAVRCFIVSTIRTSLFTCLPVYLRCCQQKHRLVEGEVFGCFWVVFFHFSIDELISSSHRATAPHLCMCVIYLFIYGFMYSISFSSGLVSWESIMKSIETISDTSCFYYKNMMCLLYTLFLFTSGWCFFYLINTLCVMISYRCINIGRRKRSWVSVHPPWRPCYVKPEWNNTSAPSRGVECNV